jgi:hypothetical protein
MANTNYISNRIDQKTDLYYMVKPDPQLIQLTCQLFKPAASLDADTQFEKNFKLNKVSANFVKNLTAH